MRALIESQVEGIKDHVNICIEKMEDDVQCVKREIEGIEIKIKEVEDKVQEKISDMEKILREPDIKPNIFLASSELTYSRLIVKS
ncbi:hypothetical protein AVEN_180875-1 [Araneus ventricosus]|uniref:Uncharacterized protein n=1 Tax=Araneus ventricosus TaxID=182803 RepID=A0A4Y2XBR2_ARAVE|nr:hypothetical protein AVEN_180875-1 [Araneus ventricosus]